MRKYENMKNFYENQYTHEYISIEKNRLYYFLIK